VFGTNLPGTATVTIKATPIGATTPISVTRTVIFTGAIDTLSLTFQFDNNSANGAFAVSTEVTTGATPNSTTFTNGFRVGVTAKDTAGTGVAGFTPDTLTVAPATCATLGATTASSYSGTTYVPSRNVMTVGSAPAGTKCTVTAKESVTVNAVTSEKVATGEFTIGGTFSSTTSVMTVDATNMDPSTSQTVKVTVKDKDGVLIGDGTSVTLVASAGAVAVSTQLTANGVASFTYVSPGTAQSVGLTAVSGTLPAVTKTITVAAGAGAATGTGGFTGTAPAKGSIGLLVTSGASNAAGLVTALGAAGCTAESLAILEAGTWKIYINGAPAVVNTAFPASIAATTAFFVRCAA
jgi:hypothetical protein